MAAPTAARNSALWLLRITIIIGILVLPAVVPITWVSRALQGADQAQNRRAERLRQRLSELERSVALLQAGAAPAAAAPPSPAVPPNSGRVLRSAPAKAPTRPARVGRALLEPALRNDPVVTRIQRRLALVETVIQWQKPDRNSSDLAHFATGMGVVVGPSGDLLVAQILVDPWLDPSLQARREVLQTRGGSAAVLYRVWGSGLTVLDDAGRVNAQTAMVFDQPLRIRPVGNGLVSLDNVGFAGEDVDKPVPPKGQQTVLGFRWPTARRAGLPEQTRPLQTDLAFGVDSPGCAGCFLFDRNAQLIGYVDSHGVQRAITGAAR